MRKISILIFLVFAFLVVSTVTSADKAADKAADHAYVGAKKCKACHKDNHTSWSETGHAKAFELLSAEEQKDPKCVVCHTTGTDAKGVLLEGVQCEACHSPGSDYKSIKIMSKKKWKADPATYKKMAIEAGLVYPDEKVCVKCHTKEGNANYKEFKFAERKDLVHPAKAEAKAKAEGK